MRNFLSEVPFLRIVLFTLLGVGIEIAFNVFGYVGQTLPIAFSIFAVFFLTIFFLMSRAKSSLVLYNTRGVQGFCLSSVFISIGFVITWLNTETNNQNHLIHATANSTSFYIGKISTEPIDKLSYVSAVVEVSEKLDGNVSKKVSGKILANFSVDSVRSMPMYGDVIVFKAVPRKYKGPQNPYEFDFRLYQSFHNVFHQVRLNPKDWKVVKHGQGNVFFSEVYSVRAHFLSVVRKYVKSEKNFAVASAIMLGYHDFMSADITRAYASSGALHVLSVSGLHVGIIYLMLNFLLKWMDNKGRKWVVAKTFLVILFIWFYACITGLSPSVLRSATMFSMIQIGAVMIRYVNIYNVIAASAWVLMIFSPFIVTEVGFRLSYLAVIGIIYLQPKIYSLIAIKNWLGDKAWGIVSVSVAAQIATAPLGLYYFHQFPNLFLLSNLFVIPLSNFILFTGSALFFVSEVPFVNDIVGFLFNGMIAVMNKGIFLVDSLPYALIQGISITMIEMLILYIIIFLLCWFYERRPAKILIAALCLTLGLVAFNTAEDYEHHQQCKFVVYSVPRTHAMALIQGSEVRYDFDSGLYFNTSKMLFHIQHHWWAMNLKKELPANVFTKLPFGKLYKLNGNKILVADTSIPFNVSVTNPLKVDYLVIKNSPKTSLKRFRKIVTFDQVIFDSSNKPWKVKKWLNESRTLNITTWDVVEQGAFLAEL